MKPTKQSRPSWWMAGHALPRRRYPLRWREATRRPLVCWAEMGGWCLITIARQEDGLYLARIVDKTATKDREKHLDFPTVEEAKDWLSRRAQELCAWKRSCERREVA